MHRRNARPTYADEAQTRRAGEAIAGLNHNGPSLKSVHRTWRAGRRLYFAEAGAFKHWDRFVRLMEALGVTESLCDHR